MEDELCLKRVMLLKAKDRDTYEHSLRVGELCKLMAGRLSMDDEQTKHLFHGGLLHDIGKMFIDPNILQKRSALTKEEWTIMQRHASFGAEMMSAYGDVDNEILDIIRYHHERWNGRGYPYGLSGKHIPRFARICGIIDSFDSMVSDRPYRKGLTFMEAKEELVCHSGTQFDKQFVDLFISLFPSIQVIYHNYKILI
ncbi:putative nucleotidyltransferase with HDIG domain [Paenibacillus castaneae]|uniref:HD-GYP domain-containing protein n=1 Tax=Paenibacillus castaneae TaxID=474957 RepID=UPI001FD40439|nr:HD-GYP domain-containing protein [Paenibacillus castaneae]NIK77782.1 putative nucleotidyltransferase with HDIG domain [Paenibacillus castaneae]